MTWLLGMLILLPVNIFHFPFNLELVDIWVLMALPVFWLSFLPGHQTRISLPYTFAILFILIGSFASTFAAPNPSMSIIVILKEIYLFVWFVTVTALLSGLNARDLRRIMFVWAGTVILHGLLIISQFLFPDIWRMATGFAGQATAYAHFRPSGLFISEKAGDANKAAFFQLLGFVPLVLAKPSKRIAIFLGILLFSSILATGSMGATIAFIAGLGVAVMVISLSGHLVLTIKILARLAIIISLLGGVLFFIISENQRYQDHLERILFERAEKSSGGRLDLWQRGIDVYLDSNLFLLGIGPGNFRVVDPAMRNNQLHSDFIAFSVERGLLGALGLLLFATLAVSRAAYMVQICNKYPDRSQLAPVVFLGAIIATTVESLTHQIFHFRALWLVLAFQEALLFKMTTSESGVEPITSALDVPPHLRRRFFVQWNVTGE
jgi:hypothetical protein